MASGLKKKFPFSAASIEVHAAAMDPRFRSLAFANEIDPDDVRDQILQLASACHASEESPDSSSIAVEPSAKKPMSVLDQLLGSDDCSSVCTSSLIQEQVALYLMERPVPKSADPMQWWTSNASRFDLLVPLAKRLLCTPGILRPRYKVMLKKRSISIIMFILNVRDDMPLLAMAL